MGIIMSTVWRKLFALPEVKVIIVGLDNAGKTTILYQHLLHEVVVTAPTIGSNVEEVEYNNIKFVMWDLGGQHSSRASWATYYNSVDAILVVCDSTDRARTDLLKQELHKMLGNDLLSGAIVLVYANKQDVKGAMSATEITDALALHEIKSHAFSVQESCALTGFGLKEGMDWVAHNLSNK